jgi:adenine-specific DNA methylase
MDSSLTSSRDHLGRLITPGVGVYPRRLIETDFPIARISETARDGRSVHHGHITAIHIWWARKPLPSCRAAILAAGLLDPTDPLCPSEFTRIAAQTLSEIYGESSSSVADPAGLRRVLLRFVGDVSAWQTARSRPHLDAARRLLQAAQNAIGAGSIDGVLAADPFSGGGSLPLEALRLGFSAYASDLNPVAATISKVTLEYVQRHGERLFEAVATHGAELGKRVRSELERYYPTEEGGREATAYLWFRTIRCEGPGCGAEVPLTSKFHLLRAGSRSVGFKLAGWQGDRAELAIAEGPLDSFLPATVRRGAATCLRCGYTTPVDKIRQQLSSRNGGSADGRLVAVALAGGSGVSTFRLPTKLDIEAAKAAANALAHAESSVDSDLALVPDEPLPPIGTLGFRVQRYGILRWRDLFTPRQLLVLSTLADGVAETLPEDVAPGGLGVAVRACLALAVDRMADYLNTGCSWNPSGGSLPHFFTRQAVPIIWDFGEANPFGGSSGDWDSAVTHLVRGLRNAWVGDHTAEVTRASAGAHPLPTDCAHVLVTDPPYYDAIPYADLSDFFYVWLRRMLRKDHPSLFQTTIAPREGECIVNEVAGKDRDYFRNVMTDAMREARRITRPDGVGVIIFAHKSTAGWEDQLTALIDAGWIITASWPIDTENASRLRARNSAVLASSIHLVCRPREKADGTLITDTVGNWRDVLAELPPRIHAWMSRLANEGIAGADAIFACLGPALEIFSRYARVETAAGKVVPLREYLEQVWAMVSREALSLIFRNADTTGFEEDARLTAMWLWTLSVGSPSNTAANSDDESSDGSDDDESAASSTTGYILEFDVARKIAQGLGANLDALDNVVQVQGGTARLLGVGERAALLAPDGVATPQPAKKRKSQLALPITTVDEAKPAEPAVSGELPKPGRTVLDRVHQAMLLFAANRGEAVRRFLVEEGVGQKEQFWRLAQALSVLYPVGSDEKRWVEGLLARKKGLGF